MIITESEANELFRTIAFGRFTDFVWFGSSITRYFAANPHFLLYKWFDEYRWYPRERFKWRKPLRPGVGLYRSHHGDWLVQRKFRPLAGACAGEAPLAMFNFDAFDSAAPERAVWRSGFLSALHGLDRTNQSGARFSLSVEEFLDAISDAVRHPPTEKPSAIISPKLWTPAAQHKERLILKEATEGILKALFRGDIELRSLSWRQLEDIVGELLVARGLEIHHVTESPQGGRDLIFRGELLPGLDPVTVAVEVKHREVVGVAEVHQALSQNRRFPALLFVTSGRFTSGVYAERDRDENHLRLFLKDGVAIGDLIRMYGLDRGWPDKK